MARYAKGRKEDTHKRVVQLASERFRKDGIDAVGVKTLMGDAGLTAGGFYAHFESKEALVREAVTHALAATPAIEASRRSGADVDLGAYIDHYLRPKHRDNPAKGCAIAALGPDLSRRPRSSRVAFAKEAQVMIECLADALPKATLFEARLDQANILFAHLLGTLQLARFATDKVVSDRILETGRIAARKLAGLDEMHVPPASAKPRKGSKMQ